MHKTSALVEASLLAALAALFTIVGNYLPFLYALANFFWPLCLIICGRRHGLKWSVLSLVVASIMVALFLNPMEALFKLATVSFAGLVLGECMKRQISPLKTIFLGSVATLVSMLLGFGISFVVMGIDPLTQVQTMLEESLAMSKDLMAGFNLSPELTKQLELFPKMAMLLLPASIVLGAPFSTTIDYYLARKILTRMGDYYPPFPAFSTWRLPKYILVPYGLALVGLYFSQTQQESFLYKASVNVFYFMCITLMVEALALIRWFVLTKNLAKLWFSAAVFLALTNPLVSQLMIILGAYDLIFDFRMRYGVRK